MDASREEGEERRRRREEEEAAREGEASGSEGEASAEEEEEEEEEEDPRPAEERAADAKAAGNVAYKAGQYRRAVELYSEAVRLAPREATFYGNRAAALMMLKEYRAALNDSLEAVRIDESFVKGYARAAECHLQMANFDAAAQVLTGGGDAPRHRALRKQLDKVGALRRTMDEAVEHLEAGRFSPALGCAQGLLADMSDCVKVQVLLADAFIGLGRFEQALALANGLFKHNQQSGEVLRVRGTALHYTGSTDLAMRHFQQILRNIDPDNRRAMRMYKTIKRLEAAKARGAQLFKEGRLPDAIEAFGEALEVDPPNDAYNAALYNNRAAARVRLGQWDEALADCDAAVRLRPGYTKAQVRRVDCLMGLERFEEAVREVEELCQQNPDDRALRGKLREAKLELKKSKRKNYYKILDVPKTATNPDIKRAYRKAAMRWHPDKNRGSEEVTKHAEKMFKDIGEAYGILSDARKRQRYDQGADIEEIEQGGGHGHGMPPDVDLASLFNMFGGGHSHGRGGGGFGF